MSVEAPGSAPAGEERAALVARLTAEKSEALARLAAGIAHELRNPLAVILARVQLLELGLKNGKALEPERLERALRTIEEQAFRTSKIIESLSVFARPRVPEIHPIDLGETVGHVLASLRTRMPQDAALLTNVVISPEARTLLADPDQLTTALTQLVVNALEAMPSGGRLEIRARRADGTIDIAVADTGPGVAPHDAPRIFDPFFSTKPAASGLGLCVAQTIAESHGGTVRLAAARAAGAEFVLTLPARG
ncbi:MAG TPA: ATP-binding protein [Methylomirabilota bacterium]|jgi:signal transduction histidine kinase|nr:ATP-binding protein [Methylomirabilota bacterium]